MPLPLPNLDDRQFQDLVDEAKRRIPHYCPEWTDHNVSDPGVTLIELFAGMVDTLIYRLNQVPKKNYIAFMNLIGLRLEPPIAAKADLTFWLAAPSDAPVDIPANTEVETDRWRTLRARADQPARVAQATTGDDALVALEAPQAALQFSTDARFTIYPATNPPSFLIQAAGAEPQDRSREIVDGKTPVTIFTKQPVANDMFYIGDTSDLSAHILGIDLAVAPIEGLGIKPDKPPLRWEAWCGEEWREAEWDRDTTLGLNQNGRMILYLPKGMQQLTLKGKTAYWVRCVCLAPTADRPGYSESPIIATIRTVTLGGTVAATHSTAISSEILGISNGDPGQIFRLEYRPVLDRRPGEHIQIQDPRTGKWQDWREVADFSESRPNDTHYVIDSVRGEVRFGPLIREPSGRERQFGARPDPGGVIMMRMYRTGGGTVGNVGDSTITLLKTAVPRIERVTNRRPASGGLDEETLDHAMLRAPRELRSSARAVVADDFEHFALQASRYVARAKCIQPPPMAEAANSKPKAPPGTVRVLIVPHVHAPDGQIEPSALQPSPALLKQVSGYLDERRLLTTFLAIGPPDYTTASVVARLRREGSADAVALEAEIRRRLYRFINPLVGGPDGKGWPFGRSLNLAAVFALLQATPGVAEILEVQLFDGKSKTSVPTIAIADDALLVSGDHRIQVTE
jgi:predicted phage baseplate assembly protein